jgi:hypothetical protein
MASLFGVRLGVVHLDPTRFLVGTLSRVTQMRGPELPLQQRHQQLSSR